MPRRLQVLSLAVVLPSILYLGSFLLRDTTYERPLAGIRIGNPFTCKRQTGPSVDHTSGVTGKLFHGRPVKVYPGSRLFSAAQSDLENQPAALSRGSITSSQWAVVTTISKPSQQVLDTISLQGWAVVVVGDKGGAPFEVLAPNAVFLSPAQQQSWAARFPELLALLPWRHFGRKNLGFLYAIANGATSIWDFDDDNGLKPGMVPALPSKDVYKVQVGNDCEAFNPYPLMGAPAQGTGGWPRGLPLNLIKTPCTYSLIPSNTSSVAVLQSLADNEPDVDGIFRLTQTIPFKFDADNRRSLVLPQGTLTPWNAQATLVLQPALWSLLLPVSVHGRVSDIWRSYISQRLLWDIGMHIAFSPPLVTQVRNPHNPLADMAAEHDLYYKSAQLVKFLRQWQGTAPTVAGRFEELMVQLYEREYIGVEDVSLTQQWLQALVAAGYKFPQLTAQPWWNATMDSGGKGPTTQEVQPSIPTVQTSNGKGQREEAYRVAIAAQGLMSQLAEWVQVLPISKADLFYLAFDQPCPTTPSRNFGSGVYCIFMPNSTWTTGRNQLAAEIYHHEAATGFRYKYWSFFDADYLVNLQCTWCVAPPPTGFSGGCCIDRFVSLLLSPSTQYAMVAPSCLMNTKEECLANPYSVYNSPCPDARANAFHRDAVPIFIPYSTAGDNMSWWLSQQILFYFAKHCLPVGANVQVMGFSSHNGQHASYPRTTYKQVDIVGLLNATVPVLFNRLFLPQSPNYRLPKLGQKCGAADSAQVSASDTWRNYGAYRFCLSEQSSQFAELAKASSLLPKISR